jgi:hypothetical protein
MKLELLQRLRISSAFSGYSSTYNTANTETGSSASDSLRIPLVGSGLTIDWGDGNVDTGVTSSAASPASHTYSTSGIYTVEVSGGLTQVEYANVDERDKQKLIDISQWGDIAWTSFSNAYNRCVNLVGSFTDAPDMSNVSSVVSMFVDCFAFNQPINHFDMSNQTSLSSMLAGCYSFNQPLDNWDISNVNNAYRFLRYTNNFDQDISGWDITRLGDMRQMWQGGSMPQARYDALLIGWEATLQAYKPNGVGYGNNSPNFGSSQYTGGGAAAAARASLVSNFDWSISDGGIA